MAKVRVPDTLLEKGAEPQFEALMRTYQAKSEKADELKKEKADIEQELTYLKGLIRDAVVNMGLAKGSTLRVEGVGRFNFTTQKYWRVPTGDERERLVHTLLEEQSVSLLTVGKRDLNDWCRDREDREVDVPDYLQFIEDANVPVISLKKAPKHKE